MLTGDRNLDTIILNNLEDKDLVRVCRVNKLADKLCKDQTFWLNRILSKFKLPLEVINKYKGNRSWSQYYINDLRKININNRDDYFINGYKTGRLDYVIIAIQMGVDIHARNDAAIVMASHYGNIDIVKYLVEAGAHGQNEAMIWASEAGHTDIVRYLVEAGADIHALNDYAIRYASKNGHLDTIKYLVEKGANIHAKDDAAIEYARYFKHMDVVQYLESLP